MQASKTRKRGGSLTGAGELVGVDEARDRLQLLIVAGTVDIAVGEDQGAAFAREHVVPTLLDSEAPETDAVEILVELDDMTILPEGGVEIKTFFSVSR